MEKLNEWQQEFFMYNIGLVYFACNKYNLDFSLACIGFCKAILNYEVGKTEFSTYAIKCMRQENQNQYKKQRVKELTNFDNIEQYGGNYELEIKEQNFDKMISVCTPRQQKILKLYYQEGYTQLEIANMFNVSYQRIQQIMQEALNKLRNKWVSTQNINQNKRRKNETSSKFE